MQFSGRTDQTTEDNMATGKEHEVEGKLDQAKGSVKEGFGALTGDRSTELEGKSDRLKGNLQESYGKLKDDLENDSIDRDIDRDINRNKDRF
jgi:uncharacterized protein YjbJ (UPF0337 family)